ncbi:hypothetical protein HYV84_06815 [Candidatus Woesearchaeota archaeon]|nr:hypothetical protein [Candidatus Woesearchaeota archaeon]
MNMEDISQLDPERFKRFVRHICFVAKKHKDRQDAHESLDNQLGKIKRLAKAKNIDSEIEKLQSHIRDVLDKEARLAGVQQSQQAVSQELWGKVRESQEKVKNMQGAIEGMHSTLDKFLKERNERQEHIMEIEEKIKSASSAGNLREDPFAKKLSQLERRCSFLKAMQMPGVDVLEKRIAQLRGKLAVV